MPKARKSTPVKKDARKSTPVKKGARKSTPVKKSAAKRAAPRAKPKVSAPLPPPPLVSPPPAPPPPPRPAAPPPPREPAPPSFGPRAYCANCGTDREMRNPETTWNLEGRRVQKGSCAVCGNPISRTVF